MDQAALVEDRIEDGRRLYSRLSRRGFDVKVAGWIKPLEEGRWLLYIASRQVDAVGVAQAYASVQGALERMSDAPCLSLMCGWSGQ